MRGNRLTRSLAGRSRAPPSLVLPQEEALAHNDTVVLRGQDRYLNLPNKTLRLLRYTLTHPAGASGHAHGCPCACPCMGATLASLPLPPGLRTCAECVAQTTSCSEQRRRSGFALQTFCVGLPVPGGCVRLRAPSLLQPLPTANCHTTEALSCSVPSRGRCRLAPALPP